MSYAIVASGLISDLLIMGERIKLYPHIIAVDGGLRYLVERGIKPSLIIGDFDSCDPALLELFPEVPTEVYPIEKDKSDTELAIEAALNEGAEEIVLFGSLGGRTDHTLANLYLLAKYPLNLRIETETEKIFAVSGYRKIESFPNQLISFFTLPGRVRGVETKGLKWELNGGDFPFSLSNRVLKNSFEVSVKGEPLIIIQHNHV